MCKVYARAIANGFVLLFCCNYTQHLYEFFRFNYLCYHGNQINPIKTRKCESCAQFLGMCSWRYRKYFSWLFRIMKPLSLAEYNVYCHCAFKYLITMFVKISSCCNHSITVESACWHTISYPWHDNWGFAHVINIGCLGNHPFLAFTEQQLWHHV